MLNNGVSHYIVVSLDEIAWALNLRGTDISYNPVFHAFLIITTDQVRLFINPHKLTAQIAKELSTDGVKVYMYNHFYRHIEELPDDCIVLTDPARINSSVFSLIPSKATKKEIPGIITIIKSKKTETEIFNLRETMVKDGVAMVKFLFWLNNSIKSENITEIKAAKKLQSFRAENEEYIGESFSTISAYGDHGAIVHYNPTSETDKKIKSEGLFLIDSGGQYWGGTTDITRTIAFGKVTEQAVNDFTLVLKGHINIATAVFPLGTRGVHLDTLAREPLWEQGLNYGHGTGHGIGFFLNVHEGPQSLRPQDNGVELEPGMVTSNEPGLYRQGDYGIRIENLILCQQAMKTEYGQFLKFETLTLCPIDKSLISKELLTVKEIKWLNGYHQKVFDSLAPYLDRAHLNWLKEKTVAL